MITTRSWLGISSPDWFIYSDTPHTGLLVELDCLAAPLEPAGSVFADAVEVIGACAAAARRRLGVIGAVSAWQQASALTGGRLLAPAGPAEWINTSRLLGAAG
jgi:hypothetical protein